MADRPVDWLLWSAALAMFVAVVCGLFSGFLLHAQARLEQRPVATGRMTSLEIVRKGMPSRNFGSGGRLHLYWVVDGRYSYEVAGRQFNGTRLSSRVQMSSAESNAEAPDWLKTYAARFAPGTVVTVHYDPSNPEQSVLEIDRSASKTLEAICVAGALVTMMLFLIRFLARSRSA